MTFPRRLLVLVLAVLALATPAVASTVVSTGAAPGGSAGTTSVISLNVGGVARSYRLFVPTLLPPGPRPLLLSLHGYTMTAAQQEAGTALDKTAPKGGVLVAYPDGLDKSWNAGTCCGSSSANKVDDVGFVSAVIADVASRYSVDRLRIAMSGFSNGGMMSYRYACERSDLVDAIVVVGGAYVAPSCTLTRPLSVLHLHGLLDTTVPYLGGIVSGTTSKVRPTLGPIGAIANLDGCTSLATTSPSLLVTQNNGAGCPAGVQVTALASSTLAHSWPTGTTAVSAYGFDATSSLWGFLASTWATRGAPVQL